MKNILIVLAVTAVTALASANEQREERGHRGPPRMNLTDDQRTCLESKIGRPGEGERPSREAMEAAFTACNIEKPQKHGKRHHRADDESATPTAE